MENFTVQFRVIVSLLLLLCYVSAANKYSKEYNKNNDASRDPYPGKDELFKKKLPQMYEERPFRILKVQLLWEKAKKRIPEAEWPEIYTDLKIQDKLELETKKRRTEGKDNFGDLEGETRDKMMKIMKKYNLYDDRSDENETVKQEADYFDRKKMTKQNKFNIELEKKLDKLWKKAEMAGFTDVELAELKKEFIHHQQKIDEFNQLKNQIYTQEDNTVDGYRKASPEDNKKENKRDFKRRHQDLLDKFRTLEETVTDKSGLEFNEPRVVELWMLAKKSNFSDVELESFKSELKHFEIRLQKLEFYQSQANYLKSDKSGKLGKDNELYVDQQVNKEDHIFRKADEHERKVKKLHYELKSKVATALGVSHAEL